MRLIAGMKSKDRLMPNIGITQRESEGNVTEKPESLSNNKNNKKKTKIWNLKSKIRNPKA